MIEVKIYNNQIKIILVKKITLDKHISIESAQDKVVVPGLINTHTHYYESLYLP